MVGELVLLDAFEFEEFGLHAERVKVTEDSGNEIVDLGCASGRQAGKLRHFQGDSTDFKALLYEVNDGFYVKSDCFLLEKFISFIEDEKFDVLMRDFCCFVSVKQIFLLLLFSFSSGFLASSLNSMVLCESRRTNKNMAIWSRFPFPKGYLD